MNKSQKMNKMEQFLYIIKKYKRLTLIGVFLLICKNIVKTMNFCEKTNKKITFLTKFLNQNNTKKH